MINIKPLTVATLASGSFDPWYDKFNYALNTTQCPDGTLCPFPNNQNCCHTGRGVKELHYNYPSSAVMPTDVVELPAFYAVAGYTFPSSIPCTSTCPDVVEPSTFYAATDGSSPTPKPSTSTHPDVVKPTTFHVSTGYALSSSITSMSAPPVGL